jgi:hypothetical protein
LNFFIGINVRRIQQILVDRDAADVIQIRLRNGGAMDLSFAHGTLHKCGGSFPVVK